MELEELHKSHWIFHIWCSLFPLSCSHWCSHIGGDGRAGSTVSITVRSFRGAGVVVYVAKQPGMESVQLLVDDRNEDKPDEQDDGGNIWSSLSRLSQ